MKRNSGLASVLILAIAIIILVAGIALYGYTRSGDGSVVDSLRQVVTSDRQSPSPTPVEISESDDVDSLQAELETTVVNSPDEELQQLEQEMEEL